MSKTDIYKIPTALEIFVHHEAEPPERRIQQQIDEISHVMPELSPLHSLGPRNSALYSRMQEIRRAECCWSVCVCVAIADGWLVVLDCGGNFGKFASLHLSLSGQRLTCHAGQHPPKVCLYCGWAPTMGHRNQASH